MNRDDVGVLDLRGDPRLALEASPELRVFGELGRDHLERDNPVGSALPSAIHDSHAAAARDSLKARSHRALCQVQLDSQPIWFSAARRGARSAWAGQLPGW